MTPREGIPGNRWQRLMARIIGLWEYCSGGIWNDTRRTWKVTGLKTINLAVRTFMDGDVQSQACAMTYRTMLAIVPALALLFAIGRGFGFQNLLEDELFRYFPAQREAVRYALRFVDSYLNQASEGIFVGVGLVFLLWTLISLVSNVEDTFNQVWGVKQGRSIWRKISDYTALLLILPVLMICASGVTLLLSNSLQAIFHFSFMTPLVSVFLEIASWVLTWMFFAAVYMLIPNTKVKFTTAFVAGVVAGTGFKVLQWLFVTGQLYVAKYNAIYGSFSFLPLMLIWMQLAWMITLAGAVLCYSAQNIFQFSFDDEVSRMSQLYRSKVTIAIAAVVTQRFVNRGTPVTRHELIHDYDLPARLVGAITDMLCTAGVLSRVVMDSKEELYGYQVAVEPDLMTLDFLRRQVNKIGTHDFIPNFDQNFEGVNETVSHLSDELATLTSDIKLQSIKIKQL